MSFKVEGLISAMITPFTEGGAKVDYDKVSTFASWLVGKGAAGLFPCGTTGEGMLMTLEERKTTLEVVLQAVGQRATVIAHTGCFDFHSTLELTCHAAEAGAPAAAIVAPGFYGHDDSALRQYYTDLAKAVAPFPILLYNIPSCARNTLSSALVLELGRDVENIVGIKDSSGNFPGLIEMITGAPKDFMVINGVDDYGLYAFQAGAPAAVSGLSNVVCDLYVLLYNTFKQGKIDEAVALQEKLTQAARLFQYGAKSAIFKEGARLLGCDGGFPRSPQRLLTAQEKEDLAKNMRTLGLIA